MSVSIKLPMDSNVEVVDAVRRFVNQQVMYNCNLSGLEIDVAIDDVEFIDIPEVIEQCEPALVDAIFDITSGAWTVDKDGYMASAMND